MSNHPDYERKSESTTTQPILPFMFNVYTDPEFTKYEKTVVLIGPFDLVHYDTKWMHLPELLPNNLCLIPDISIVREKHEFASEEGALMFIREWWTKQ